MDYIDNLIAFEEGTLSELEEIKTIQSLINSGQVWKLQGSYGRAASDLIEAGLCILGKQGHRDYWGNHVPSRTEVKKGTKGSIGYAVKLQGQAHANIIKEV